MEEIEAPEATSHRFECRGCGAELVFEPGSDSQVCEYCGYEQAIDADAGDGEVVEYDFEAARSKAATTKATDLMEGGKEVECDGCGAKTVHSGESDRCPYCDSPVVVARDAADDTVLRPESVLPFKVTIEEAREKFREWLSSRWFAPSDLVKRAQRGQLDGVYTPYWTYDTKTSTRYTGSRGEHYYVTETYTDSEGKTKTRQVRKTRWYPAAGTVLLDFDDLLICASKALPRKLIRELEPWDLENLTPYKPEYLSGFVAERYQVDLESGFGLAKDRMVPPIRRTIRRDIGGDEQHISTMSTQYDDVTFKHCLLPIWLSCFRYDQKPFRIFINARTGEVQGERPYSWVKIALLVLSILAVIGGILFATSRPTVKRREAPTQKTQPVVPDTKQAPSRTGQAPTQSAQERFARFEGTAGAFRVTEVFTIGRGERLSLAGATRLTFTAQAGLRVEGELRIEGSRGRPIVLEGDGWRGVEVASQGSVDFQYVELRGAEARAQGGGLRLAEGSSLAWSHGVLERCRGSVGGGIFAERCGATSTRVVLEGVEVRENVAQGDGGGIHASAGVVLELHRCAVSNNRAGGSGGGVVFQPSSGVRWVGTRFEGNRARVGGGVYVLRAAGGGSEWSGHYEDLRFSRNVGESGSGVAARVRIPAEVTEGWGLDPAEVLIE